VTLNTKEKIFGGRAVIPANKTFVKHRRLAGIDPQDERDRWADFHSLRVTFATLLAARFDIYRVSFLMRHSDVGLTSRLYVDLGLDARGAEEISLGDLFS
jgi:integrase